ncbi:MAG: hypothetical protein Pars2KO_05490 [Parasphingorhabdus sp.]
MTKTIMATIIASTLTVSCGSNEGGSSLADNGSVDPNIETYGYSADADAEGIELGRQVYTQWCAICHEDGPGMAGTEALMRKYRGELPALLRERDDLAAGTIETFVRQGVKSMPTFRKTEISDEQLAALSLYLTEGRQQEPGGRLAK